MNLHQHGDRLCEERYGIWTYLHGRRGTETRRVCDRPHGEQITFTGRNAAEVRDWVNEHPRRDAHETWFLSKSMTTATGNQAWRYAKGEQVWDADVLACVYSPGEQWRPVKRGEAIERTATGYVVRSAA